MSTAVTALLNESEQHGEESEMQEEEEHFPEENINGQYYTLLHNRVFRFNEC